MDRVPVEMLPDKGDSPPHVASAGNASPARPGARRREQLVDETRRPLVQSPSSGSAPTPRLTLQPESDGSSDDDGPVHRTASGAGRAPALTSPLSTVHSGSVLRSPGLALPPVHTLLDRPGSPTRTSATTIEPRRVNGYDRLAQHGDGDGREHRTLSRSGSPALTSPPSTGRSSGGRDLRSPGSGLTLPEVHHLPARAPAPTPIRAAGAFGDALLPFCRTHHGVVEWALALSPLVTLVPDSFAAYYNDYQVTVAEKKMCYLTMNSFPLQLSILAWHAALFLGNSDEYPADTYWRRMWMRCCKCNCVSSLPTLWYHCTQRCDPGRRQSSKQEVEQHNELMMKRCIPGPALVLHVLLYSVVVDWFWAVVTTASEKVGTPYYDGKLWSYTGDGEAAVFDANGILLLFMFHLLVLWAVVKLRAGVVVVCSTPDALRRFRSRTLQYIAAAAMVQVILVCKYLAWYYETLDAARSAADAVAAQALVSCNGTGISCSGYDAQAWRGIMQLEVAIGILSPAHFATYFAMWCAVGTGLGTFGRNTVTVGLQIICISLTFVAIMIGYSWADLEMSYGTDRFWDNTTHMQPLATLAVQMCGSNAYHNCIHPIHVIFLPWIIVFFLLGLDVQSKSVWDRLLRLPPGKKYHFFICHHQASGGNQARILHDQLTQLGCKVWLDNDQDIEERTTEGMKLGVRQSATFLIFLSGRKQDDSGQADKNGEYQGTFTRFYCHEEITEARKQRLTVIGVKETDPRFGAPDFGEEKSRAMCGGKNGGPVHKHAEENLRLLDDTSYIERQTSTPYLQQYVNEILKQGAQKDSYTVDPVLCPVPV
jgi:hypothetical protein